MQASILTIGATVIPFAAAWVQLKSRPHEPTAYEVCVPRRLWSAVFDPGAERPETLGRPAFLRSDIEELGMLGVWFERLAKNDPPAVRRCEWVIATADDISEHDDHLRIAGRAERFEPWRFPEVRLLSLR